MQRTNIYLAREQTEILDRRAAELGTSRSELIRRLLDRALAEPSEDLAGDLEAIEASYGALPDLRPVRRARDDRARHLERVARARG